jgi:hypothetical protein
MKEVIINKMNEGEYAGSRPRVLSFFGLQLSISSQRYYTEEGVNNYLWSYSLVRRVNKDGIPLYKKKTRGFKIVTKGRHVWGGAFSRTQTFKRIAE